MAGSGAWLLIHAAGPSVVETALSLQPLQFGFVCPREEATLWMKSETGTVGQNCSSVGQMGKYEN